MTFETVQSYFDRLSDTEFNDKFLELAHSSAFSRVVSGAQQAADYQAIRQRLRQSAVPAQFYATEPAIDRLVRLVAARVMKSLGR